MLAFVFAAYGGVRASERTYARKFFDITGDARWIWAQHRMNGNEPLAFFASRDFTLQACVYTRLGAGRSSAVFLNGREIAGRRWAGDGARTSASSMSRRPSLVQTGHNRIVLAARAAGARADSSPRSTSVRKPRTGWSPTATGRFIGWDPRMLGATRTHELASPVVIGARQSVAEITSDAGTPAQTSFPARVTPPKDSFRRLG